MVEAARDYREECVKRLRELADAVEKAEAQPSGVFVQIFWKSTEVSKHWSVYPGFNPFEAAGVFLRVANEISLISPEKQIQL